MLTLNHPKDNENILSLLVAQGTYDSSMLGISGRATCHWPPHVVYPVKSDLDPNTWALSFFGLVSECNYDLEILNQDGQVVAQAHNLTVVGKPAGVTITFPAANTSHCVLTAYGVTSEPDNVPLSYIKLCPDNTCTNGIDGQPGMRFNGYWSVKFPNAAPGTYILKVGHSAGGAATKSGITVGAC